MFVIMAVATDERVADGLAPLAVGLTVGFCALMGGPLTGASMNPAKTSWSASRARFPIGSKRPNATAVRPCAR